ncbi:Inosine-5'-monophosphate dehydrogenase [compost metagenome]
MLPASENSLDQLPVAFGKHGDFLAQIAHQAAAAKRMPSHALAGIVDKAAQALKGCEGRIEKPAVELARKIAGVVFEQGLAEGILALEVMVERALGHAYALEHGIDAGGTEPLLGENLGSAMNQRLARILVRAGDFWRTARLTGWNGSSAHGLHIRPIVFNVNALISLERITMSRWPDTRILDLLGIELPIIQAPMAGSTGSAMAIAVSNAGGLGSLPCATLSHEQIRQALQAFQQASSKPLNVNFFCHQPPATAPERDARWKHLLKGYYRELGADFEAPTPVSSRAPFDEAACALVEEFRPAVVSFHFGLPASHLLARVKASGAKVLSSATTVAEALWLEQHGCDAIIAMGYEAGGHRGMFLSDDLGTQVGTLALVPQIVDAVQVPVIAAGGIGDARGIVAAFALGACAVQLGTAYLFCPEAKISPAYRQALATVSDSDTALTNLFTGRPARGINTRIMRELGPMNADAPAFPLAGGALMPLRAISEPAGNTDFSNLWSGQAARLGVEMPAGELTKKLAAEALVKLGRC